MDLFSKHSRHGAGPNALCYSATEPALYSLYAIRITEYRLCYHKKYLDLCTELYKIVDFIFVSGDVIIVMLRSADAC